MAGIPSSLPVGAKERAASVSEMSIRVYQVAWNGERTETRAPTMIRDDSGAYVGEAHPSEIFPPCTCGSADCPDRNRR
jgi:hypothetical protein